MSAGWPARGGEAAGWGAGDREQGLLAAPGLSARPRRSEPEASAEFRPRSRRGRRDRPALFPGTAKETQGSVGPGGSGAVPVCAELLGAPLASTRGRGRGRGGAQAPLRGDGRTARDREVPGVGAGPERLGDGRFEVPAFSKLMPGGRPLGNGKKGGGCEFRWEGGAAKGRGPGVGRGRGGCEAPGLPAHWRRRPCGAGKPRAASFDTWPPLWTEGDPCFRRPCRELERRWDVKMQSEHICPDPGFQTHSCSSSVFIFLLVLEERMNVR